MPSPIPIVLGVTGHQNPHPDAVDALRQAALDMFDDLRGQYRSTPLLLLSPLNEGGDRLIAEVALSAEHELIVPLAWPESVCPEWLYRSEDAAAPPADPIRAAKDSAKLQEILRRAKLKIELPLLAGVTEASLRASADDRRRQRDQAGAYIIQHSQILIALWDGKSSPNGATAKMVAWQRDGAPFVPPAGMLDEIESGPVYHLTTPRSSGGASTVSAVHLYPEERPKAHFDALWKILDRYNADLDPQPRAELRWIAELKGIAGLKRSAALKTCKDWLLPESKQPGLAKPLAGLFEHYAQADEAAMRFQRRTHRVAKWLFALVAAAVLFLELYAHLLEEHVWLLGGYILLLGAASIQNRWSRDRGHQERHLDYRALAEALRVQLFWTMAGVPESAADHYLRHFRSELDWIRHAVRTCNLICGCHQESCGMDFPAVMDHWVKDQKAFFERRYPEKNERHELFERMSRFAFGAAVVLAIFLFLAHVETGHMQHGLAVMVFLMAFTAAAVHEWGEKSGYMVDAQRYEWMAALFGTAEARLSKALQANRFGDAQALVKELGQEALSENADWVIQHRQRPVGPPSAG